MLVFDADAYDRFAYGFARLTKSSRVSTMTLTSRLVSSGDDTMRRTVERVMVRAMCLTPDTCEGCTDVPRCVPSRFCREAFEMRPFPSVYPGVCIRLYSTGSLIVTGCTTPEQVVGSLHDMCLALQVSCLFPTVRLVNATSSVGRIVALDRVRDTLVDDPTISGVSRPERQSRLLIKTTTGETVMMYASGKFTVHGNDLDRLDDLVQRMKKFR